MSYIGKKPVDFNDVTEAQTFTVTGDLTVDTNTLFVDSTNNRVGVGTVSPAVPLHVKVGTNENFYMSSDSGVRMQAINDAASAINTMKIGGDPLIFLGTGGTERMRIDSSGNVGIGTNSIHDFGVNLNSLQINGVKGGSVQFSRGTNGATEQWALRTSDDEALRFESGSNYATERMRITSGGELGINTTSNSNYAQTSGDSNLYYRTGNGSLIMAQDADDGFSMMYMNKFDWNNTKDSRYINWYKNGATVGSIELTSGGLINYGGTSDYRLKENIVDMTGAIDRIKQVQPKQFNMIDDPDDTTQDGFLAHELATVVPQSVTGSHNEVQTRTNCVRTVNGTIIEEGVTEDEWTAGKTDGVYPTDSIWSASWDEPIYQMADYAKLVPLLTAALQEAVAKIETLEAKVTALENA